jgi:hypothetical protein
VFDGIAMLVVLPLLVGVTGFVVMHLEPIGTCRGNNFDVIAVRSDVDTRELQLHFMLPSWKRFGSTMRTVSFN